MLSGNWQDRKPAYDFVIVGSGYGGAITAARLAAAELNPKPSICILERGKEWPTGSFPDTFERFAGELQSDLNPLGLYEMLNYADISVLKGNGLGGSSLINANVALIPDEEVFSLAGWPASLTREALLPYFRKVQAVLEADPHPHARELKKFQALDRSARAAGRLAEPVDIAVNFRIQGRNPHGVDQTPCIDCGDCVTGCNVGAKNTLPMNYLPMARNAGAEMYTQARVDWVEKLDGGGWRVHGRYYRNPRSTSRFSIDARNVVLAAGAIHSPEILLRSHSRGLSVSPRLGSGFSGNGDFYAIAYNSDHSTQVLGFGNRPGSPGSRYPPGPTIVGVIRRTGSTPATERFVVQDVAFPSALVRASQISFGALPGQDTDRGDEIQERLRVVRDLLQRDPHGPDGALNHTLFFLVSAFDDARGAMEFEAPWWDRDGRVRVVWDDVGRQRNFRLINEELRRHARALGATFVENGFWAAFDLRRLITVHPLGGCPIGEDHEQGAADEYGRVFSSDGAVHEGLFVADGSLLPSALGANPLLTISALAERSAERKIEQCRGRDYSKPKTAVAGTALDPMEAVGVSDAELERMFKRHPSLGIEHVVNSGERRFDVGNHRIYNDTRWKGFLPKGLPLGELAAQLYTGYNKRFWKKGKKYLGETQYLDSRVMLRHSLEEISIDRRVDDLDPGRYILLRYLDPPFTGFYDVMKVITENLIIYRGYIGVFPHGRRGFTASVLRTYGFEQMSAEDHRSLFEIGTEPEPKDLLGSWRVDVIASANHATGAAWVEFYAGDSGRVESRFQSMGLIESLLLPAIGSGAFQPDIRRINDHLLVGKWLTSVPEGFSALLPEGSLGLFHVEQDEEGEIRLGLYCMLTRVEEKSPARNTLLEPLFDVELPPGVGMIFDEEMVGWYAPGVFERSGKRPGQAVDCRFRLTMAVRDLEEFVEGDAHQASAKGTISFGSFQQRTDATFPVHERASSFQYLVKNLETGEAEMRYHLEFQTDTGERFVFQGRKFMQKDTAGGGIQELLEDYTTLYADVYEHEGDKLRELGTAYLKFRTFEDLAAAGNLAAFLRSFRITGTDNPLLQAQARLKFLAFTSRFVRREYDPRASGRTRAAGG